MDTIELKDFLDFTYLSDVALSPDGSRAAYLRHRCDTEKDGYATQLWVTGPDGHGAAVGAEGKKPLVAWESGDTLLYGVPSGEATSFTRYYAATGLSVSAFTVPLEARSIEALGGGIYLLSARTVLHPQDRQDDDCVIVTDLPVQSNGTGYVSGTRISLFLFDIRDGGLKQITPPTFETMQFSYCAQWQKIVLSGQCFEDKRIIKGGISVYDLADGSFRQVLTPGDYRVTWVSMLEGQVVFAGTLGHYNTIMENPHFYLLDLATGDIRDYAYPDLYIGGLTVGSDCRYGGGIHCKEMNGSIYFTAAKIGDSPLFELAPSGETREVTRVHGSVDCFDVAAGRCVIVGMRDMGLEEVYSLNLADGSETALTDWNGPYIRSHAVVRPQPLFFPNDEGSTVSGWVMEPLGFDSSKKYPAILDIHGGPKGSYGEVYYHEMQIWAQAGYFVFFCNPRGSDGHGDAYSRIMGLNGTKDYDDLMNFTDLVLARYPQIDPARIGVTGGSYGGYMTNWIVSAVRRPSAALATGSFTNTTATPAIGSPARTSRPMPLSRPARPGMIRPANMPSTAKRRFCLSTPIRIRAARCRKPWRCMPEPSAPGPRCACACSMGKTTSFPARANPPTGSSALRRLPRGWTAI